jgi:tryptophanyl-tRNA synthetase
LGDVKVKRFLIAILEEELAPIRARRKEWEQKIHEVYALLEEGCNNARAVAAETLADVRRAMKINYFEDKELIDEQARRFRGE